MRFSILPLLCGIHIAQACSENNCLRALIASAFPSRTASADCSSYLRTTVTPATVTYTATVSTTVPDLVAAATTETDTSTYLTTLTISDISTIDVTSTVTITPAAVKRQVTVTASDVPAYASACSGAVKYASACSCIGVSAVTITALAPSTTVTVTTTSTSTSTSLSTVTTLVTSFTTATATLDETTTVSTTVSTTLPPSPVSTPFTLEVEGTGTFYDGSDLYFDDCGGGNGHPFLYEGGTTSFVFGSDGFLHVESCFNVIGGTFQGDEPAPFWFDDPTRPGNGGFVGAPCSDVGGYLACTGTNGETVFFFPDSFGIDTTLNIGDANYGTPVDPKINY